MLWNLYILRPQHGQRRPADKIKPARCASVRKLHRAGYAIRAPETIRTSDTFFRREVLYPLSYGGNSFHYTGITQVLASYTPLE